MAILVESSAPSLGRRRPRAAATTEFGAALASLGIKHRSAARWFHTSERNIRRWKSGDRRTPPAVGIVLRLLAAKVITISQVEQATVSAPAQTNGHAKPAPPARLRDEPKPKPKPKLPASLRVEPTPAPVPANPGQITLAEKVCKLTAEVCHWPLGDPRHATFCFCSAPVVTPPYCPRHYAQAITPAGAHGGPSGRRLLPSANINQDGARTPAPAGTN